MTITDLTVPKDAIQNSEIDYFDSNYVTRVTAPYHYLKSGKKLDEFHISRFFVKTTKISVGKKTPRITKDDIQEFENRNNSLAKYSAVVFQTEWDSMLDTSFYFDKNPGLTSSAAEYLISKGIKLVGIDTPNIEEGIKQKHLSKFRIQSIFAENNVLIIEGLTNLRNIGNNFTLIAFPLRIKDSGSSPIRAVAYV